MTDEDRLLACFRELHGTSRTAILRVADSLHTLEAIMVPSCEPLGKQSAKASLPGDMEAARAHRESIKLLTDARKVKDFAHKRIIGMVFSAARNAEQTIGTRNGPPPVIDAVPGRRGPYNSRR